MTLKLAVQENLIPGADLIDKWNIVRAVGYDGDRAARQRRDARPPARAACRPERRD